VSATSAAKVASVTPDWNALVDRARAAMAHAYAPYSEFHVGAALQTVDGEIYDGCNVENAAYPAGICAERAAIAAAVVHGARQFSALVIATTAEVPTPPCGMCRQVLEEFAPDIPVLSVTSSGLEARWTMSELLPAAFTPTSLRHR
jgi:cytidine deaminase